MLHLGAPRSTPHPDPPPQGGRESHAASLRLNLAPMRGPLWAGGVWAYSIFTPAAFPTAPHLAPSGMGVSVDASGVVGTGSGAGEGHRPQDTRGVLTWIELAARAAR